MITDFSLPGLLLRDVSLVLRKFTAHDSDRPTLGNIYVGCGDAGLQFAATDGYKMALFTLDAPHIVEDFPEIGIRGDDFAATVDFVTRVEAGDIYIEVDRRDPLPSKQSFAVRTDRRRAETCMYGCVYDSDPTSDLFSVAKAVRLFETEDGDQVPEDAAVGAAHLREVLSAADLWGTSSMGYVVLRQKAPLRALRLTSKRSEGRLDLMLMPVRVPT